MERDIVPRAGFAFRGVSAAPLAGRSPLGYLKAARNLLMGEREASKLLRSFEADAVVGTGGYAAAATVIAALLRRCPVVVHEQNAVPGRTNRILGRFASRVAVTFPGTERHFPLHKTIVTGMPIRRDLTQATAAQGRERFGLRADSRVLLVHGGSQGALVLNRAVVAALPRLLSAGVEVLHLTGHRGYEEVLEEAGSFVGQGYHPVPYVEEMGLAYAAASLVLGRAGASTFAETTVWGLPMVLVPYPHACSDHQTANARAAAAAGAAEWLRNSDLSGDAVADIVLRLLGDPATLSRMARASRALGRADADESVADLVSEALGREPAREPRPSATGARRAG